MQKTVSITVTGIVQGVYYRQSTKAKALELGVKGEVRNSKDGSVGIVATASTDKIEEFIAWCKRGPETAVVKDVVVENIALKEFDAFKILR